MPIGLLVDSHPTNARKPVAMALPPLPRPLWRRVWYRATSALRGWAWRRRLRAFGQRSNIDRPAHVFGGHAIAIGERVSLWRYARLEAFAAEGSPPVIEIGDDTVIQPFVHIGAVRQVRIGKQVLMASRVYITDHDHDYSDPDSPVVSNNRVIVEPVTIGDRVWLGEGVMVLKGVTIGEGAIVGAASVVTKDVPPYSIAVGAPARVVRHYDAESGAWVSAAAEVVT